MKKSLGIMFLCVFVLGCVAVKPERVVNNNVFYSTADPKLEMQVNHTFEYLGESKWEYTRSWGDWADTVSATTYCFVKPEGKLVVEAACIGFFKLETPNSFWTTKCSFVKGGKYVKMGGKKFCQAIRPQHSRQFHSKKRSEEISERGYTIPPYYIVKALSLQRYRSNVNVRIFYAERISYTAYREFKQYYGSKEARQLTDSQKAFLESFDKTCEQAFQIVAD